MSYFPMFIQLKSCPCLVAGGGRTACRKVEVLKDFGADIRVIAPEMAAGLREISGIILIEREFEPSDLSGIKLAVAATDNAELNSRIAALCEERGILVNAVDQIEDCSFIFPSYLKTGEVVAAFSSGGNSPAVTQYLKERNRPFMTKYLGELAASLGSIRDEVKQRVPSEDDRKRIYLELLALGLEREEPLPREEIESVICRYRGE